MKSDSIDSACNYCSFNFKILKYEYFKKKKEEEEGKL